MNLYNSNGFSTSSHVQVTTTSKSARTKCLNPKAYSKPQICFEEPNSDGLHLVAMASNLVAMAFKKLLVAPCCT